MKIYTKRGDQGNTSLLGGSRVPKYDLRIDAYGTVDELNAHIGLLSCMEGAQNIREQLINVQDTLFIIGSHLANDTKKSSYSPPAIDEDKVSFLEQHIDTMEAELPPLTNFVLPGGHVTNAQAHVARTVCRRAERRAVELSNQAEINPIILKYLNRLSDWLFVCSRKLSFDNQAAEMIWTSK